MKEIYSNINIIGGGLIGALTAYSLSKTGFTISLIEKKDVYSVKNNLDYRTVAISEGTKLFLEKIGLWYEINKYSQPIKKIKIIDRLQSNTLEFDNTRRESNLGYIVKNKHLLNIVYKKLRQKKNIKIFNNSKIKDFENTNDFIITNTENFSVFSSLNIAADGKNSFVRKHYKIPLFTKDYNKKALVITFCHEKNHHGAAYEFFYKNGPLAILPMKFQNPNFVSSIVWTNEKNYLDEIMKLSNEKLISILNNESQYVVGRIKKILTKQSFHLTAHLNTKFYSERTIFIGDSAHSFHPIAGQGWNLGMKDLENLYYLIFKYRELGIEIGDQLFCKEYHDNNYFNSYRLYQVTDKLDNLFKIQNPIISLGRSFGLNIIQKNKTINNFISDFAMGVNL